VAGPLSSRWDRHGKRERLGSDARGGEQLTIFRAHEAKVLSAHARPTRSRNGGTVEREGARCFISVQGVRRILPV